MILSIKYPALSPACKDGMNSAETDLKQAQSKLKTAQSELKKKQAEVKKTEKDYQKDMANLEAVDKSKAKLEVHVKPQNAQCILIIIPQIFSLQINYK